MKRRVGMRCSKQRPPVAEKEGTCLSKKDLELRYNPVQGERRRVLPL